MKRILLFLILICVGTTNAQYVATQNFWTEVAPFDAFTNYPRSMSIVDSNVIWANCEVQGTVPNEFKCAKTSDGGLTWDINPYNIPNSKITSLQSISNNVAYVTSVLNDYDSPTPTGINGVWKTIDGGVTWNQQTSAVFSIDSFVNNIYFWDANKGAVLGDPVNNVFLIYMTLDAGNNWVQVPAANIPNALPNEYGYNLNIDVKGNTIWFGTSKGRIFKSINQGLNWTVSQSPVVDFGIPTPVNFTFKDENKGYIFNEWNQWQTLDGGNTWIDLGVNFYSKDRKTIYIPETTNSYYSFGENIIDAYRGAAYSLDETASWFDLNLELDPIGQHLFGFKNSEIGFCFGDQKFYKISGNIDLNRVLATTTFTKNNITLSPNPATNYVTISGEKIAKISICDITGKVVLENQYSFLNQVSLNVESFQSGVYLVKVTSENDTISTLKFIKE